MNVTEDATLALVSPTPPTAAASTKAGYKGGAGASLVTSLAFLVVTSLVSLALSQRARIAACTMAVSVLGEANLAAIGRVVYPLCMALRRALVAILGEDAVSKAESHLVCVAEAAGVVGDAVISCMVAAAYRQASKMSARRTGHGALLQVEEEEGEDEEGEEEEGEDCMPTAGRSNGTAPDAGRREGLANHAEVEMDGLQILDALLDGPPTSSRTTIKYPSGEGTTRAEAERAEAEQLETVIETGTMVEARIEAQTRQIAEQHESLTRRAELVYSYRGGVLAFSVHAEHA